MLNFNAITRPLAASLVTGILLCIGINTHAQAADYKKTRACNDPLKTCSVDNPKRKSK